MFKSGDIIYANDNYTTLLGPLIKDNQYTLDDIIIQHIGKYITYKISGDCFNGHVFHKFHFYTKNQIRKKKCLKLVT